MSSYLTFYLVPKKTRIICKEGKEEEVKVSEGIPLPLIMYTRSSNIYQLFYEEIHPVYAGLEEKYTTLTIEKMKDLLNTYRREITEDEEHYRNKVQVIRELGGNLEAVNINELIEDSNLIKEKKETLSELEFISSLVHDVELGYTGFEKVLINID